MSAKKEKPDVMRLDQYIAKALQLSRSQSRRLIAAGQAAVDGVVCRRADAHLVPNAAVTVSGRPLSVQQFVYLMLNKPQGVVSASRDRRDTTVADLAAGAYPRRELFPAGRLDKDSTGFILLTDDGALAHTLLAPRRHVPKTYLVRIDVPVTQAMIDGFARGVTLADGTLLAPAALRVPDTADPCAAEVILRQGVYHQIKRMFGQFGAGVEALHRTAIGGVRLDDALASGQWRELTAAELDTLRAAAER